MDRQRKNSSNQHPSSGKHTSSEGQDNDMPMPTFDEGERKPSPITSTTDDGVRTPIPTTPAGNPGQRREPEGTHTEATMPPGEGRDPKRNTM